MRRKDVTPRYVEIGRIRAGEPKTKEGYAGKARQTFRLSSNNEQVLMAAQEIFGGTTEPWTGGENAFHLRTDASAIPVGLVDEGLHTAWEQWGKAGCTRRCDGETCNAVVDGPDGAFIEQVPCLCESTGKLLCTGRLQLRMALPYLPGIGVWIFTSSSEIATGEIPPIYDSLMAAMPNQPVVPAVLKLEPRSHRRHDEKFDRDYIVPTLSSNLSMLQLMTGADGYRAIAEAAIGELPS